MAERNAAPSPISTIPLSMGMCLTQLPLDLVLLDTQEEPPPMLPDQALVLESAVLHQSQNRSTCSLLTTLCQHTLSEDLANYMLGEVTHFSTMPWGNKMLLLLCFKYSTK